MSRILALDMAGNCGFAVSNSDHHGFKDLRPKEGQRPGARYQKLRMLLDDTLRKFPDLSLVVYEAPIPFHKSMNAAEFAWGYVSVAKLWGADQCITVRGITVTEWKKYLTGHGGAKKEQVMDCVRALGYRPENYDHSDALGILAYATQTGGYDARFF